MQRLSVFDRMEMRESWEIRVVCDVNTIFYRGLLWLEIKPSPIEGSGLFAARDFFVGEQIAFYDGVRCERAQGRDSKYVIQVKSGFVDAKEHWTGLFNNSKKNNARSRETGGIYATARIIKGAEILIPYGSGYWSIHCK